MTRSATAAPSAATPSRCGDPAAELCPAVMRVAGRGDPRSRAVTATRRVAADDFLSPVSYETACGEEELIVAVHCPRGRPRPRLRLFTNWPNATATMPWPVSRSPPPSADPISGTCAPPSSASRRTPSAPSRTSEAAPRGQDPGRGPPSAPSRRPSPPPRSARRPPRRAPTCAGICPAWVLKRALEANVMDKTRENHPDRQWQIGSPPASPVRHEPRSISCAVELELTGSHVGCEHGVCWSPARCWWTATPPAAA